jgi:hypothetical protein
LDLAAILNTVTNCDSEAGFTVERALYLNKGQTVFDVLTAEAVKSVTLCNSEGDNRFVGNYHPDLHGKRSKKPAEEVGLLVSCLKLRH